MSKQGIAARFARETATAKPTALQQLAHEIELVLIEQASDSGQHPEGGELVLVNARTAAEAAASRILPRIQATVDHQVAAMSRDGD